MVKRGSVRRPMKSIGVLFGVVFGVSSLWGFNQPPLNMSATTFLDGGAPRGVYYLNYSIFVNGDKAFTGDGKKIPGDGQVNVLTQLHQFYYHSPLQLLGGDVGLMVAVPVVALTAKGSLGATPLSGDTAGLGDVVFAPAIQWDHGSLMGNPVFYRAEFDVTLPTGRYNKDGGIDPGSNLVTYNPYVSVVWLFQPKWETSWRFFYAHHSTNKDHPFGTVKPGQAVHLNYAVSREVFPKWRLGVAGYYLQQLKNDTINGVKERNTKERVVSAGPGLAYLGQGLTAMVSYPIEFSVENRFRGSRATLQIIHKF
jgi:hypothetical protein